MGVTVTYRSGAQFPIWEAVLGWVGLAVAPGLRASGVDALAMSRAHHSAEPSCPVADDAVPSCSTGPVGQARFVAGEMADMARTIARAARRRHGRQAGADSHEPPGDGAEAEPEPSEVTPP